MGVGVQVDKRILKAIAVCANILFAQEEYNNMHMLWEIYDKFSIALVCLDDIQVSGPITDEVSLHFSVTSVDSFVTVTLSTESEYMVVTNIEVLIADAFAALSTTPTDIELLGDLSCIIDVVNICDNDIKHLFEKRNISIPGLAVKYFTQKQVLSLLQQYNKYANKGDNMCCYDCNNVVSTLSKFLSGLCGVVTDGLTEFELAVLSVDRGVMTGKKALFRYGLIPDYNDEQHVNIWTRRKELHMYNIGRLQLWYNSLLNEFDDAPAGLYYDSEKRTVADAVYFSEYFDKYYLRMALYGFTSKLDD